MDLIGGISKAFSGFMGNDRSAPGAPDLGFDQGRYDDLLKSREGYINKFEGKGGYADRAAGIGTQYGGLMDNVLGKAGTDGTRSGGLYGDVMGKGGLRDQAKGLQANAGDMDYLMKDRGFYAGLAEQQRAGQDKANQEMLRRSLSNESGGSRTGFLNRFKSMTDPLGEQRAGDALQAANMSMQNRQGMLGQQGQFLGQQSNLVNQGMQMQNQAGNFLGNQLTALGQESGYGSMGYQDAIAQMNQLDQARLAQAGMNFQGDMADFNRPTGFDQMVGAVGAVGGLAKGLGSMGVSDKNLKTNINEVFDNDLPSRKEVKEFLDALTPYYFEYKNPQKHGVGGRIGIMAQDLEKTKIGKEIVINTPEGKKIDIWKGVGLAIAAQANIERNHLRS